MQKRAYYFHRTTEHACCFHAASNEL